ncbi:unnamed protein product, partial [Owenia fusiformis]
KKTILGVMDEIRSWWEVPSIAHFCSLFREAFDLPDFDIEELEDALMLSGTEENSPMLEELIWQLLGGCYQRKDVGQFNWELYLKDIVRHRYTYELNKSNPFESDDTKFINLTARQKVELLHSLCDFRLDADDVFDRFKGLDADTLRLDPLGTDNNGATYWYFYGTRLYREDSEIEEPDLVEEEPIKKKKKKKKKKKSAERAKKGRKKKGWGKSKKKSSHDSSEEYASQESDIETEKSQDENIEIKTAAKVPDAPPNRWHMVCSIYGDWVKLTESFKESRTKCEKELYKTLSEEFLPEISNLMQEKEKAIRRRQLESQAKRTSRRLEAKKLAQAEANAAAKHEDEGANTEEDDAERQRELEQQRQERLKAKEERAKRVQMRENRAYLLSQGKELPPELVNFERQISKKKTIPEGGVDPDLYAGMYKVLDNMRNHDDAWPFWEPVQESIAPGYSEIIETPMDMSSIEKKLNDKAYLSKMQFLDDFQLMFENCREYNGVESDYSKMSTNLEKHLTKITKKYIVEDDNDSGEEFIVSSERFTKHTPRSHSKRTVKTVQYGEDEEFSQSGRRRRRRKNSDSDNEYTPNQSKSLNKTVMENPEEWLEEFAASPSTKLRNIPKPKGSYSEFTSDSDADSVNSQPGGMPQVHQLNQPQNVIRQRFHHQYQMIRPQGSNPDPRFQNPAGYNPQNPVGSIPHRMPGVRQIQRVHPNNARQPSQIIRGLQGQSLPQPSPNPPVYQQNPRLLTMKVLPNIPQVKTTIGTATTDVTTSSQNTALSGTVTPQIMPNNVVQSMRPNMAQANMGQNIRPNLQHGGLNQAQYILQPNIVQNSPHAQRIIGQYMQQGNVRPNIQLGNIRPNMSQGNMVQVLPQGNMGQNMPHGQNMGPNIPQGQNMGPNMPQGQSVGPNLPQGQNMGENVPQGNMGQNMSQGQNIGLNMPQGQNMGQNMPQGQNMNQNMPQGNMGQQQTHRGMVQAMLQNIGANNTTNTSMNQSPNNMNQATGSSSSQMQPSHAGMLPNMMQAKQMYIARGQHPQQGGMLPSMVHQGNMPPQEQPMGNMLEQAMLQAGIEDPTEQSQTPGNPIQMGGMMQMLRDNTNPSEQSLLQLLQDPTSPVKSTGQMVQQPQQMMGQPQQMPGQPQQMPGQLQQMPGQLQQMLGQPQQMPGQFQKIPDQPQQMQGQPQQMPGQLQKIIDQPQQMQGQPQQMPGQLQKIPDQPQQMQGQPQQMPGQLQKIIDQPQQMQGQPQQMQGQPQQMQGQPQQMQGQPQQIQGQTQQTQGQPQQMQGQPQQIQGQTQQRSANQKSSTAWFQSQHPGFTRPPMSPIVPTRNPILMKNQINQPAGSNPRIQKQYVVEKIKGQWKAQEVKGTQAQTLNSSQQMSQSMNNGTVTQMSSQPQLRMQSMAQLQTPMSQHQTPMSQHQTPMSQHQTSMSQNQIPMSQNQTPMSQNQTPMSQHQVPFSQPQSAVLQDQIPSSQQTPVSHQQPQTSQIQDQVNIISSSAINQPHGAISPAPKDAPPKLNSPESLPQGLNPTTVATSSATTTGKPTSEGDFANSSHQAFLSQFLDFASQKKEHERGEGDAGALQLGGPVKRRRSSGSNSIQNSPMEPHKTPEKAGPPAKRIWRPGFSPDGPKTETELKVAQTIEKVRMQINMEQQSKVSQPLKFKSLATDENDVNHFANDNKEATDDTDNVSVINGERENQLPSGEEVREKSPGVIDENNTETSNAVEQNNEVQSNVYSESKSNVIGVAGTSESRPTASVQPIVFTQNAPASTHNAMLTSQGATAQGTLVPSNHSVYQQYLQRERDIQQQQMSLQILQHQRIQQEVAAQQAQQALLQQRMAGYPAQLVGHGSNSPDPKMMYRLPSNQTPGVPPRGFHPQQFNGASQDPYINGPQRPPFQ